MHKIDYATCIWIDVYLMFTIYHDVSVAGTNIKWLHLFQPFNRSVNSAWMEMGSERNLYLVVILTYDLLSDLLIKGDH